MAHLDLATRIDALRREIECAVAQSPFAQDVSILAATKGQSASTINQLVGTGINIVGENRAEELCAKRGALDSSIKVHFIGQLQTNKVKRVLPCVDMVHSLDRASLCKEIHNVAQSLGIKCRCLVQINLCGKKERGGVSLEQAVEFAKYAGSFEGIELKGVMALAERGDDENKYLQARQIYDTIKGLGRWRIDTFSMGMSQDFALAIRCGANLIRIGSYLFKGLEGEEW